MVSALSRRPPYPWHLKLPSGSVLLLTPKDTGQMIARKADRFENVRPTAYDYSSYPPFGERTLPLARCVGGYGERVQSRPFPVRIKEAINVDFSIGGMPGKGPLFHLETPATTGQPDSPGVDALDGGVLKTFRSAGRYVLVRNGDGDAGWVVSKDFGAARTVRSMARFKNAGVSVVDGLYVALDNGVLWQYDGTLWNACTLPASFLPEYLCAIDDLLALGGGNVLRTVSDLPTASANYSGSVVVGDSATSITGLAVVQGSLVIFKSSSVHSLNDPVEDTTVNDLLPEFRGRAAATNGRNAVNWGNRLWFRFGDGFYAAGLEGGALVPRLVGPERLLEHDGEVRGPVVAFAGHLGFFGYMVLYNASQNASYLVKHGTWLNPEEGQTHEYRFAEVPNGAITRWAGKQATTAWISTIAGTNQNERLYVAFTDGTHEWCNLPRNGPNPYAVGSGCEFTLADGYFDWPDIHGTAQGDPKSWRGVSCFAPAIGASTPVRHFYRTDPAGVFTQMPDQFTSTGQRVDFPTAVSSRVIQQRTYLDNTSTSQTPVLEGMALHFQIRPAMVLDYQGVVDATPLRARRDGLADGRSTDQIRQILKSACQADSPVAVSLPTEEAKTLIFYDYGEELQAVETTRGPAWGLPWKAVEFATQTVYGTHARLMQHSHLELAAYTHAQLEVL